MKKLVAFVVFVALTSMSFAQKNEVKAIEKAIKSGNFPQAKAALTAAEALMGNMDNKLKAKFLFLKAKALYAEGKGSDADLDTALQTIKTLKDLEASPKGKYTSQVNQMAPMILNTQVKKASDAYEAKDFPTAIKGFERAYQMSPQDTVYLYYAASSAVSGQDYDVALKHYKSLQDMGYKGQQMVYYATDKETGKEEQFGDKSTRDIYVRGKSHIKPRQEMSESKEGEITRLIALIYSMKNEHEQALTVLKQARELNPEDTQLIIAQAKAYLASNQSDKVQPLLEEADSLISNDAGMLTNFGIFAMEIDALDLSKSYFERALAINPGSEAAALNLSTLEIEKGNKINDQMNALNMRTNADFAKYDKLKEEKNVFFRSAVKILENYLASNPNSKSFDIYSQLKNIYSALGENKKSEEMNTKAEALKAGN